MCVPMIAGKFELRQPAGDELPEPCEPGLPAVKEPAEGKVGEQMQRAAVARAGTGRILAQGGEREKEKRLRFMVKMFPKT